MNKQGTTYKQLDPEVKEGIKTKEDALAMSASKKPA
jgi:hypothetical protein